jgi:hypothetical protein
VDNLFDHATLGSTRRFAFKLDWDLDRHLFASDDAEQVHVQHMVEKRVPLHVLQ